MPVCMLDGDGIVVARWDDEDDPAVVAEKNPELAGVESFIQGYAVPGMLYKDGNFILPPPDPKRLLMEYQILVENFVDEVARDRGYSNGVACVSYETSTIALWSAEAQAFKIWRDRVWGQALQVLSEVQEGVRDIPTKGEFFDLLPKMIWPEGVF